ncbi:MAG: serine hydrolase [Acidobacteria bacterium]|nr:serine hydrolase [Acidobacteriota bacterium]
MKRFQALCFLLQLPLIAQSIPAYDEFVNALLAKHGIPGAALAVTRNGRLVHARGYGFADRESQTPVQPDSLFRVASLSKAITAVAVMHLVEEGRLHLDQPAFSLLPDLQPSPGIGEDPRLAGITIRHLLEHSAGWDRNTSIDPMFEPSLTSERPASAESIIRAMRARALQLDPGTRYAYSNFGYSVLGRIIERVTGASYEQYVRAHVLAPMGISDVKTGNTLEQGRLPGEVKYYTGDTSPSVFADTPRTLPTAYGGFALETLDAHGGWVASVIDYAKFLNAIDGRRGKRFLSPASVAAMTARPGLPEYRDAQTWYGFGLSVRPIGAEATWWHSGSLPGTITYMARTANGFTWVLFLNYRPTRSGGDDILTDVDRGLSAAFTRVTAWPATDLFANYPDVIEAPPALTAREGVVNAATNARGIVSGSWLRIHGTNLAAHARTLRGEDVVDGRLPTLLDGVSVKINGMAAVLYSISPSQIEAQAPAGLEPGWVNVEVTREGTASNPVLANSRHHAPGVLSIKNQSANSIVILGTGFEPSPAGILHPPAPMTHAVQVEVGDQPANVTSSRIAGPGLFQMEADLPSLPAGDYPVTITVNGVRSPAGPVVSLGSAGAEVLP